ncbi:MAG: hypothetical protein JOS17DRAFT_4091 [Linnemannia elongata]|nr:MAG: hypothetical protein JOS17DRAFT_4091 [Linnemannia elongata]
MSRLSIRFLVSSFLVVSVSRAVNLFVHGWQDPLSSVSFPLARHCMFSLRQPWAALSRLFFLRVWKWNDICRQSRQP